MALGMEEEPTATLTQQISAWGKDISPKPDRRSESIAKLIEALAKAQLEFDTIRKETKAYNYKYADLAAVINATQPQLAKHGLVVTQEPFTDAGMNAGVVSTLCHSSGEWMQHTLLLPVTKRDAQGIGSAITYARRYSYQAIVGVAAELDDDAKAAIQTHQHEEAYENRGAPGRIKQVQVNGFLTTCADNGKTTKQITDWLKTLGKVQVEELTPEEFQKGLKWAHGKEPVEETLKASVKSARAKKEEFNAGLAKLSQQTVITDDDLPDILR